MALTFYGTLVSVIYFSTIVPSIHCGFYDRLGNSSLKLLPATIGSDIELRCIKVLEKQVEDITIGFKRAACIDVTKIGCGHVWSKNGTTLNVSTTNVDKYEFSNVTTVGYCSTFRDTTNAFNTFGFSNNSYKFKCLAASMKIKNVSVDDFGVYTCNFSNRHDKVVWSTPTIDRTEVVQAGTKYQVKEILYFGQAYQTSDQQMLMQCVVTGGNVKWFLKLRMKDYEKTCLFSDCPEEYIPLHKFNTTDHWRCYNFSVIYLNPYKNVSESLIGIRNICPRDNDLIICTVDGQVKSDIWENYYIKQRNDGKYFAYREFETPAFILSLICVPVLFGMLFIAFCVTAMIRGNGSFCCRKSVQYSLTNLSGS